MNKERCYIKKSIFLFFIVIVIWYVFITNVYANIIKIPNRDGSLDNYGEINTYTELYTVLEDLSIEYEELLEEYNSLEECIEESNKKVEELQDEMQEKNKKINDLEKNNKNDIIGIITINIIIIAAILYYFGKNK